MMRSYDQWLEDGLVDALTDAEQLADAEQIEDGRDPDDERDADRDYDDHDMEEDQ